ncbi:Fe-S cluster assembly protein SufD [Aurantimonas sp. C2-6-R+9]|uniref:Fe-S cluster assembly protein SufD n=1 Tax=unclassified Aurantimonas TaxID=2638230 RepID=UPI002E19F7C2|nr:MULTISPECIES: Fe-S cluster assembly protein SufD [unclassified Aurantimonas]MEC5290782.1 Fe-S cluster assembly protein SufD [Aurantimonas sp. C2-3-R2]MEC5380883.1 Fe-S cluster assembly protein SufD [Aurantimonas sp. C2-6-R+9]MEC5411978.1 Fe-S cluster assembly protein SufD [Aurantimonas sp. C2-4-R8]
MNVHQMNPRTPAETALIERAESTGVVADAKDSAVEALRRDGLPNRRVEAWHYTDLRLLMSRLEDKGTAAAGPSGEGSTLLSPLLPNSHVVEIGAPDNGAIPVGVTVSAITESADWSRSPNHLDRPVDTIRLLNASFGAAAVAIEIAPNTNVTAPLELRSQAGDRSHGLARCTVGAGAKAVFVERIEGAASPTPSTGVSHLAIGEGADVLWIVDQAKGASAAHLGQLNVELGTDASFRMFVLNTGGALVRYEVHAETMGEGGDIKIRGVNLIEKGQHIDVTTTLRHTAPHTTATETFRNVVTGGHGVFQGMIKVAKEAQKTDAKMACNTLLLSDDGDFSAKPELEIFADDVQCGHGATAGEINADHLFYLMSRGIPEQSARALLVKAFVAEIVEELEHEAAEDALMQRIDTWLERSH